MCGTRRIPHRGGLTGEDRAEAGLASGQAAWPKGRVGRVSFPQVRELTGHEPTSQEFVGFTDEIGVTERPVSARDREAPIARAEQAAGQVILFGRPYDPAELVAMIAAVQPADLARVGAGALGGPPAAVAVLGPKRAQAALDGFRAGAAVL